MSAPPSNDQSTPGPESELDRLTRIAEAAEAFSFWQASEISENPEITLSAWRLMKLASGERYLVGTNETEGGTGRVSSHVLDVKASKRTAETSSGRVYRLSGEPGRTQDSEYVWNRWLLQNGNPQWTDVTEELQRFLSSYKPLPTCTSIARLVEAHPALFKGSEPRVYSYVIEGWYSLVDKLCSDITAALGDQVAGFSVAQIKEKFGSLRFSYDWSSADAHPELVTQIRGLVSAATAASKHRCEICGMPGEIRQIGGLATARCDVHRAESQTAQQQ